MRSVTARTVRGATAWLVATAVLLPTAAGSAEEPTGDLPVREVELPLGAEELSGWLRAGWTPVRESRYRAFLERRAAAAIRRRTEPRIERAVYEATYADGVLAGGTFAADLRVPDDSPQPWLVDLGEPTIAVRDVVSDDGSVAFGLTNRDRLVAFTSSAATTVRGGWSLRGQKVLQSVEFDVSVPSAVVSTLRLRVPEGLSPESDDAVVRRESTTDAQTTWIVTMGSSSRCRLRIRPTSAEPPRRPITLVRRRVEFSVRPDSVGYRVEYDFDPLQAPLESFRVPLPPRSRVERVELGSVTPVEWTLVGGRGEVSLDVRLPDPLTGPGRRVVVVGRVPLELDTAWNVPSFRVRSRGPRDGGRFLDERGTLSFSVAAPLQLETTKTTGVRRVAATAGAADNATVAFEETTSDAAVVARVSYPPLDARARTVTFVDTRGPEWTLQSAVRWQARSGRGWDLRAEVPRGWRVANVTGDAEDVTTRRWQVRRGFAGVQTVTVNAQDALSPGRPWTVLLEASFDTVRAGRRVVRPVVRPLGCKGVDSVLLVVGPPGWTPGLLAGSDFEPVSLVNLDPEHAELLARLDVPETETVYAFHSRKRRANALLDGSGDTDRLVATTSFNLDPDGRVRARTSFEFPGGRRFPGVAFDTDPRDRSWFLEGEDGETVPVDVSWNRVADANREDGPLWRPEFVPAPTGRVVLRDDGVVFAVDSAATTFPHSPDALDFEGQVVFTKAALERVDPRLDGEARRTTGDESRSTWAYDGPVTVRWESPAGPDDPPVTAVDVEVRTTLGASGETHRVRMRTLPDGRSRRLSFQLPEDVALAECLVDGRPVVVREDDGESFVALPTGERSHLVELVCLGPGDRPAWRSRVEPLVPRTETRVRTCRWRLSTAADWLLVEVPGGELGSMLHWTQRLFGPLGRPSGTPLFNPLVPSTWSGPPRLGSVSSDGSGLAGAVETSATVVPGDGTGVVVVDRVRLASVGWVLLTGVVLFGFAARLTLGETVRRRLLPAAVLVAVTTWFLPADLAFVAGSVLAGGLVILTVPSSLLRLVAHPRDESKLVTDGSTLSFRHAPRVLLVVAATVGGSLHADDSDSAVRPAGPLPGDVLVPTTNTGAAGVVYVSPRLLEEIERLEESERDTDEYVVESADYELERPDARSLAVVARLRLRLLSERRPIRVELPMRSANVSGPEPCTVNGRPATVQPGSTPNTIVVELDERTMTEDRIDVVLQLRPSVLVVGERSSVSLPTPRVPASHLRVPPAEFPEAEVTGSFGETTTALGELTASLGPVSAFGVRWGSASSPPRRPDQRTLELHVLHDVSPKRLRTRARLVFDESAAMDGAVVWNVPGRFAVRDVEGSAGVRTEVFVEADGTRIFARLVDERPVKGGSTPAVTFDLLSSPRFDEAGDVELPGCEFLVPVDTTGRTAFVVEERRVGVTARSEWDLDLQIDGDTPEVRTASPEAFSTSAEPWAVPTPRLAFSSPPEATVHVRLAPRTSTRVVRDVQRHHVGRRESSWVYQAEIVVDAAPVFEHRIRVPRPLEVETVSLVANDVERVARWSRDGEELLVELEERSVGPQGLRVSGWMPVELGAPFELPRIELRDAQVEASEVVVAHDAAVELELADEPVVPRRLVGPVAESNVTGSEILGRFDLLASAEPLLLVAELGPSPLQVVSESRLRLDGESRWLLETRLEVRAASRSAERIEVRVPEAFTLLRAAVDETRVRAFPSGANALGGLTLVPVGPGRDRFEVVLTGIVEEPGGAEWTLEAPGIEAATVERRLTVETERWLPAKEHVSGPESPAVLSGSDAWRLERAGSGSGPPTRVVLLETRLSPAGSRLRGRTLVFVRGGPETLDVAWSADQTIETLAVDGVAVAAAKRATDERGGYVTTIPMSPGRAASVVRVDWHVERSWNWPFVRRDTPLPRVLGVEVARSLVAVTGPAGSRVRLGDDVQLLEPVDYELEWIDGALQPTPNRLVLPSWLPGRLRNRMARVDESLANEESRDEVTTLREERLERARERLAAGRVIDVGPAVPRVEEDDPGRVLASVRIDPEADRVAVGTVPAWTTRLLLGFVAVPVGLLLWRWTSRREWSFFTPDSLAVSCAVAGILWWTCLRMGGFGLVLLALSTWLLIAERRRSRDDQSEIVV